MSSKIDLFRSLALSLPGAAESAHCGHPDFRVNGRIFATLSGPATDAASSSSPPSSSRPSTPSCPTSSSPSTAAGAAPA